MTKEQAFMSVQRKSISLISLTSSADWIFNKDQNLIFIIIIIIQHKTKSKITNIMDSLDDVLPRLLLQLLSHQQALYIRKKNDIIRHIRIIVLKHS